MTELASAQRLQKQIFVLRDELSASSARVERIESKTAERTQEFRSRIDQSQKRAEEMEERMANMQEKCG